MKTIAFATCASLMLLWSCDTKKTTNIPESAPAPTRAELIKRGDYLVNTIGCADCHTPKKMTEQGPVPDMDKWLMGHPSTDSLPKFKKESLTGNWLLFNPGLTAAVGPWGTSFASNLTPDETGIGSWSLKQFKLALRKGKYKGLENSRPLMPPMPWQNFSKLTDDDLEAIFEYLKSIKPIDNLVPAYMPPSDN
ncbi:c-type cytochrome [Formosa sp. S-31]|uniref:c-type cytochrome n=1 Tax=Formosa sp. S-31 TaxID=2790949 RepID=UPI003EB960C6